MLTAAVAVAVAVAASSAAPCEAAPKALLRLWRLQQGCD